MPCGIRIGWCLRPCAARSPSDSDTEAGSTATSGLTATDGHDGSRHGVDTKASHTPACQRLVHHAPEQPKVPGEQQQQQQQAKPSELQLHDLLLLPTDQQAEQQRRRHVLVHLTSNSGTPPTLPTDTPPNRVGSGVPNNNSAALTHATHHAPSTSESEGGAASADYHKSVILEEAQEDSQCWRGSKSTPLPGLQPAIPAGALANSHVQSAYMQAVMGQVPCLLTVITADASRVLFQNAASQAYFGNLVTGGCHAPKLPGNWREHGAWGDAIAAIAASAAQADAAGDADAAAAAEVHRVLQQLFAAQPPGALQDMMEHVRSGATWHKVMQVQRPTAEASARSSEHGTCHPQPTVSATTQPSSSQAAEGATESLAAPAARTVWAAAASGVPPTSSDDGLAAPESCRAYSANNAITDEASDAESAVRSHCGSGAGAGLKQSMRGDEFQWLRGDSQLTGGSPEDAGGISAFHQTATRAAPADGLTRSVADAMLMSSMGTGPQWEDATRLVAAGAQGQGDAGMTDARSSSAGSVLIHPSPRLSNRTSAGTPPAAFQLPTTTTALATAATTLATPAAVSKNEDRQRVALRRVRIGSDPPDGRMTATPDGRFAGARGGVSADAHWSARSHTMHRDRSNRHFSMEVPRLQLGQSSPRDLADLLVSPPARTLSIMQFARRSSCSIQRSPTGSVGGSTCGDRFDQRTHVRCAQTPRPASGGDAALDKATVRTMAAAGSGGGASASVCHASSASDARDEQGLHGVVRTTAPSAHPAHVSSAPGGGGSAELPSLPQLLLRRGMGGSARDESVELIRSASSIPGVPEEASLIFGPPETGDNPPASPCNGGPVAGYTPALQPPRQLPNSFHEATSNPRTAGGRFSMDAAAAPFGVASEELWHDVTAQPMRDPLNGEPTILLTQFDVTDRVMAENYLAWMSERQLSMLSGIFPRHVIEFLSINSERLVPKQTGALVRSHDDVTILFLDVCGFTSMSKQVAPQVVMDFLNMLFTTLDLLCEDHGVQKVETAGDAYIAACGILSPDSEGFSVAGGEHNAARSAQRMLQFAKALLEASHMMPMPHTGQPLRVRVGLHTGPCVSGLIGTKLPKFSLFGDTMNTASRMESTCVPGHIQVSEDTWKLLASEEAGHGWKATGGIEVKGKGVMKTYLWASPWCDQPQGGSYPASAPACMMYPPALGPTGPPTSAGALELRPAACDAATGALAGVGLCVEPEMGQSRGMGAVSGKGAVQDLGVDPAAKAIQGETDGHAPGALRAVGPRSGEELQQPAGQPAGQAAHASYASPGQGGSGGTQAGTAHVQFDRVSFAFGFGADQSINIGQGNDVTGTSGSQSCTMAGASGSQSGCVSCVKSGSMAGGATGDQSGMVACEVATGLLGPGLGILTTTHSSQNLVRSSVTLALSSCSLDQGQGQGQGQSWADGMAQSEGQGVGHREGQSWADGTAQRDAQGEGRGEGQSLVDGVAEPTSTAADSACMPRLEQGQAITGQQPGLPNLAWHSSNQSLRPMRGSAGAACEHLPPMPRPHAARRASALGLTSINSVHGSFTAARMPRMPLLPFVHQQQYQGQNMQQPAFSLYPIATAVAAQARSRNASSPTLLELGSTRGSSVHGSSAQGSPAQLLAGVGQQPVHPFGQYRGPGSHTSHTSATAGPQLSALLSQLHGDSEPLPGYELWRASGQSGQESQALPSLSAYAVHLRVSSRNPPQVWVAQQLAAQASARARRQSVAQGMDTNYGMRKSFSANDLIGQFPGYEITQALYS